MKKRLLTLLLALALAVSLALPAAAAQTPVEVSSALELAQADRKSTRLNSSHANESRMPSSA